MLREHFCFICECYKWTQHTWKPTKGLSNYESRSITGGHRCWRPQNGSDPPKRRLKGLKFGTPSFSVSLMPKEAREAKTSILAQKSLGSPFPSISYHIVHGRKSNGHKRSSNYYFICYYLWKSSSFLFFFTFLKNREDMTISWHVSMLFVSDDGVDLPDSVL